MGESKTKKTNLVPEIFGTTKAERWKSRAGTGTMTNEGTDENETVNSLFLKGLELHDKIVDGGGEIGDEVTAVRKCVMMLEDVTRMVSALDLFSRNESIEEVSTQSVKFFLLPFLLGNLNAKFSNDLEQRLEVIRVVQTYYMDFLRRVKDYGIVSHQLPDVTEDEEEAKQDPEAAAAQVEAEEAEKES